MALLFSLEGSTELTLKFSGSAADLVGDSFLSLGRSVERGFRSRGITEFQCALRICASFGSTRQICASFGSTRLICASFGSTRLICASFGSTRLICASFGGTRLICASFGSTRLICASFGSTRLICRVGVQRGADRREAGRMREGHMDASDFLSLPLFVVTLPRGKSPKRQGSTGVGAQFGCGYGDSGTVGKGAAHFAMIDGDSWWMELLHDKRRRSANGRDLQTLGSGRAIGWLKTHNAEDSQSARCSLQRLTDKSGGSGGG
ncbi:DNA-directed RNA polymerase I subunit RPA1-like [Cucumis melo var. makuwa]|uniref:DNA-directed RNA polymerase I subunit RPA1-like n=1 Tax=Cucumis melo var. makuwa TaxID=1194695 RepID=A0A5A7VPD8_CUCMM|nr:DNA-directed RNA polymerase I subunit RPA1-like [Cucumis melo var. makuwa]